MARCCCDRDPTTDSWASSDHGVTAAALIVIRGILVLLSAVNSVVSNVLVLTVLAACATAAVYLGLTTFPFSKPVVNNTFSAANFVFAWSCFCVGLANARNDSNVRD